MTKGVTDEAGPSNDPKKTKSEEGGEKGEEAPEVKKKGGMGIFTTREIAKRYMDREPFLKLCLREMLIFLIFLIVLGILASKQHSSSEYYLSRVMIRLFVETKFKTKSTGEVINYNDISTLEQIWEYFDHYLYNTYWDYWYSHFEKVQPTLSSENYLLYENKLIGRPRVRQLRVQKDSCTVPEDFKLMFAHCYAEYSSGSEDKDSYGYDNTTAWKYASPDDLGSKSISGEISTYGGGGYHFDFKPTMEETNTTIKELFNGLWLDRGSRALVFQFTTYSGNENLFFTLQLLMELPPTGGVLPSYIVHVHKFLFRDPWDFILLVLTGVFAIFVFLYTAEEITEFLYFKWHYFDSFWNILDFWILILSYVTLVFFVMSTLAVAENLGSLVRTTDKHACFDAINNARDTYITLLAVVFFFAAIKVVKYMNFNHSMNQMQTTLSKATKDIACFSIIFFIVFVTFAQLGHLLFGSQVRDFRSFIDSVFALLRTAVGDFDYHKIENVNHFLGPIYFFTYIFFIYFILVNMFLAIIIDTYSEVRSSIRDQRKELQTGDIVMRWVRKICRCCKISDKPRPGELSAHQDIKNLLRRCGFTDVEIDLFFSKFDIPKDKRITQEEMRAKLMTNFNMAPEQEKGGKPAQAPDQEKDELGEKLMNRITLLEDNFTDINYKIDLIDNKIDAIQQIRARRRTLEQ